MRCSLAPSKLDFEPLQRRRSFLIDPVTSRANGQSLELQFVENIPTVCASARAPFPSAAGTRCRRRDSPADRCSGPVRPVPGAICRVRGTVSTPGARAHAAPLWSRNRPGRTTTRSRCGTRPRASASRRWPGIRIRCGAVSSLCFLCVCVIFCLLGLERRRLPRRAARRLRVGRRDGQGVGRGHGRVRRDAGRAFE